MMEAKSSSLYARLMPEAKKPPKGATTEAKVPSSSAWSWIGSKVSVGPAPPERAASHVSVYCLGTKTAGISQVRESLRGRWHAAW